MKIDKIILHTAFTMSDAPDLIENVKITPQDKLIYICGHGNAENCTIGGRSVFTIGDLLLQNGWLGQQIYVTSCDTDKVAEPGACSFCTLLNTYLCIKLCDIIGQRTTLHKEMTVDWILNSQFVTSDASDHTITVRGENAEPELYVLKFTKGFKLLADIQTELSAYRTWMMYVKIDECGLKRLEKLNDKYYKSMQKHKKKLLMDYGFKHRTLLYRIKCAWDEFLYDLHSGFG